MVMPASGWTDISLADQDGFFEKEITNPFDAPENTLRFYKGGTNAYVEYVDKSVTLTAGDYIFGCKYKDFGTNPDFAIYTSSNGGATYNKIDTDIYDSRKNNRSAKFTLGGSVNAIKIVMGNKGDSTDVSLAIAGVFLTKADDEKQLIANLNTTTLNVIGLSDANTNKMWNLHTDADNAAAVEMLAYDAKYFAPEPTAKTYQNVVGRQFSRILYKNSSFVSQKNVEYILTADYKVLSGKFDIDDVSSSNNTDPAFRVKVGSYYLENSKSSYFNVLSSHFDELTGKLYIRFSSKTKRTGLEIMAGNFSTESTEGACAVGNVSICECFAKADGVLVHKENIIDNITEDSICTVKNDEETKDKKWNVIYLSSAKEYKITDYSAKYFKSSPAMIEIKEGAKGARISYTDSSLVLAAGKTYTFTYNAKTVSGNPKFSLAVKTVGSKTGSYTDIGEKSEFLSYFNDQYESNTYLRSVSFKPKENISNIRILMGNIDADKECGLIVANAQLFNVDNKGIQIGDNLLSDMIKPNIKRNTTEERFWNLNADEDKIKVTAPIKDNVFALEKMFKFEPNSSYNRVEYYDEDFEFSPSTTYRFTADFIIYSGNPIFSLAYYDKTQSEYLNIKNLSVEYSDYMDKDNNIRTIEFKTKTDVSNARDFRIMVGNAGEAKDINCAFANPQLYVIKSNNPIGENLVNPIIDDTILYMTAKRNYKGFWDARYQGAKGVAVKVLEIPENFFRSPVLAIKNGNGIISQNVTVKPDTNYKYTYYVKKSAGDIKPYIKAVSKDGSLKDVSVSNELIDQNGYYSYSCEFKTPSSIKSNSNLRIGISFDNASDGAACNFQLYELNSGYETTGGNLITNSNFTETKEIAVYSSTVQKVWTIDGTLGDSGVSARATGYFIMPTSKMFIFVGGSEDNYIAHTATLQKGKKYNLSFNLKYANPGYAGDSGVDVTYSPDGVTWKDFDYTDVSPKDEFKKSYDITLPDDAAENNNLKFSIRAGSVYVSGYLANAVLVDKDDTSVNLLSNGDFSDGIIGWSVKSSFRNTYFVDIPDGYFTNPQSNKPGMIVYRNSGSWENFSQTYLNLKPDTFYLFKAKAVHPWEPNKEDDSTSVFSFQLFGKDAEGNSVAPFIGYQALAKCTNKSDKHTASEFVTFSKADVKNDDGEVTGKSYTCDLCGKVYYEDIDSKFSEDPDYVPRHQFSKLTQKDTQVGNDFYRIYKTISNMGVNGNTYFRLVMQGTENAGYWGDMELYECDEKGNILSNNVLINGDFSLGEIGWTIAPSDNFNYRIVEQPDNFFENYKKNSGKMITSSGDSKNAILGQTVEVERGKTYYFCGFYVNMNAAGISPKVTYTTVEGKKANAAVDVFYDANRFYFEIAFTLPEDAYSYRGVTTVDFVLDNTNNGIAYISDLALYEEGKYVNLFKNADFKDGFKNWITDSNYKLSDYDSSVFVFYYDDKLFDDGDWSGTASSSDIPGTITGRVVDNNWYSLENIKVTLKPGDKSVKTDANGIYEFAKLNPGEYSIYVTTPLGKLVFVTKTTVVSGMATNLSDIVISLIEEQVYQEEPQPEQPGQEEQEQPQQEEEQNPEEQQEEQKPEEQQEHRRLYG